MMGVIGFTAEGCTCASLVFNIISIALPFWVYYQPPNYSRKYHFGLWTTCESTETEKLCISLPIDFFPAVRALEILGILFVAGAGTIGALKLLAMKENQRLPLLAGGVAILAGICMIIGAIVFGVNTSHLDMPGVTLHAGFALAIVAGVISFVAGGLFFASKSN